ncbi:MAG: methylated-DNA--[protein]-cysteine S-methyltransferase [Actinomycetota bacterium]
MAVTRVAYEADGWGVGELWLDDGVVVWHELPKATTLTDMSPVGDMSVNVVAGVQAYLAGEEVSLDDVPVDLDYETDFLTKCAHALRAIPRGETVTYGELAALAGAPGAARAAGSFCARNRLGLFVPCHRVVSAGGLGSYGSLGLEYKKRLLRLEGVAV